MSAAEDPEEEPPNPPPPPLEPSGSEGPPDDPFPVPIPLPPPPAPVPAAPATEASVPTYAPPPVAVWTAVSPPADANGNSDRKKKSVPPFSLFGKVLVLAPISSLGPLRAGYFLWNSGRNIFLLCLFVRRRAEDGDGCRTCSCKKSRCLKLYCVCFASGSHCSELCGCEPCYNKPIHGVPRNAPALPLQVVRTAEAGQDSAEQLIRSPMDLLRRKCTCKKSSCLKKYCDCYQGGAGCSINCKCDDCKNPYGKKVGVILDSRSILPTPTANERNGTEVDSSEDDDDEDDYYMNRPLSPIPPSPVSRESSFQQETLVGVEVHTMNGHLYPKPLTQVRPDSWQLSRRPADEARGDQWRYLRRPSEDGTSADGMEGHPDPKFQRDSSKQPESHTDRYSITRCVEVMNAMAELSPVEKSLAPDVFLDASSREIFLSLSVDIRTMWLKRKMRTLV